MRTLARAICGTVQEGPDLDARLLWISHPKPTHLDHAIALKPTFAESVLILHASVCLYSLSASKSLSLDKHH